MILATKWVIFLWVCINQGPDINLSFDIYSLGPDHPISFQKLMIRTELCCLTHTLKMSLHK